MKRIPENFKKVTKEEFISKLLLPKQERDMINSIQKKTATPWELLAHTSQEIVRW